MSVGISVSVGVGVRVKVGVKVGVLLGVGVGVNVTPGRGIVSVGSSPNKSERIQPPANLLVSGSV